MQKLVYILWKEQDELRADFCRRLLQETAPALQALDEVQHLQVNVADEHILLAEPMIQTHAEDRPWAMVYLWLEGEHGAATALLAAACARCAGYRVEEDAPMDGSDRPTASGERTPGFSQIAILQIPEQLSRQEWLDIWLKSHGPLAIEIQSTWLYVRNIVSEALSADAPPYDGIVEEGFPTEAMTSQAAFYEAGDDAEELAKRQKDMMDSCVRFIDFEKIEVFFTSRYVF